MTATPSLGGTQFESQCEIVKLLQLILIRASDFL